MVFEELLEVSRRMKNWVQSDAPLKEKTAHERSLINRNINNMTDRKSTSHLSYVREKFNLKKCVRIINGILYAVNRIISSKSKREFFPKVKIYIFHYKINVI